MNNEEVGKYFEFQDLNDDDLRQVYESIQSLKDHQGYAIVNGLMTQNANARMQALLTNEPNGLDGAVNMEYLRGSVAAIHLCLNFPATLLNAVEQEMAGRKEKPEEDKNI